MKPKITRAQWRAFCEQHGIAWAAQFGSTVTGRATPGSDVDIAVWLGEGGNGAEQALTITNALMPFIGRSDVDVVVANHAAPLLQWSIARRGQLLYERATGMFRQFQLSAWKRHEDAKRVHEWNYRFVHDCLEEWARG